MHDVSPTITAINPLVKFNTVQIESDLIFSELRRKFFRNAAPLNHVPTTSKKDYENHAEKISVLRKEGMGLIEKEGSSLKEISQLETSIAGLEEQETELQLKLKSVQTEKTQKQSNLTTEQAILTTTQSKISITDNRWRKELVETPEFRTRYIDEEREKHRPSGMKPLKEPLESDANLGDKINLLALGDIHGWAPGLVNWLRAKEIAYCSIDNKTLNHNTKSSLTNYRKIFPDETKLFEKGIHYLPSWPNGSPFFTEDIPTDIHGLDVIWTNKPPNNLMIQVGDMVDRADYSEVVLEMMRRLIWKAQGSCFALMGNHEEMILNDYESWLRNEKTSNLDSDGKPGHQRFNVIRNTYASKEDEEKRVRLTQECFNSIRAHLAHLLLTQEWTIRRHLDSKSLERWKSITDPALVQGGLSEERLDKIVRSRGWGVVKHSLEWLDSLSGNITMPGALACIRVRGTVFTHGEPTGLQELSQRENFDSIMEPFVFQNGLEVSMYVLEMEMGMSNNRPPRNPILWDRRTWQDGVLIDSSRDILKGVVSSFGEYKVNAFVHGHSARPEIERRKLDEDASEGVTITNIDESITPNYRYDRGSDDPYDIRSVPKGWKNNNPDAPQE